VTGVLPFFNVKVAVASRSSGRTSGYCSPRRCDGSFDTALHGNVQLPLPTAMGQVALTGQRGVALFFIVSAFTLFLNYDNRKEERHPTRNFFIQRFFRLAPMFHIALALSFFFLRTCTRSRTTSRPSGRCRSCRRRSRPTPVLIGETYGWLGGPLCFAQSNCTSGLPIMKVQIS
jgi:hypothetical protein